MQVAYRNCRSRFSVSQGLHLNLHPNIAARINQSDDIAATNGHFAGQIRLQNWFTRGQSAHNLPGPSLAVPGEILELVGVYSHEGYGIRGQRFSLVDWRGL